MTRSLEDLRRRVYESIDGRDVRTTFEKAFIVFISTLIILNVAVVILETDSTFKPLKRYFDEFEWISFVIFSLEYLVRLWSCTADPRFRDPFKGRVQFALHPLALLDLLAILSFFPRLNIEYFRVFRLARFLRIFKLGRYSESWKVFARVFHAKRSDLGLSIAATVLLVIATSCFLYYAEEKAQPKKFTSIPRTLWMVVNITTVGYGELQPKTLLGQATALLIAILAVAVFAIPAGIFASGFSEEMERRKRPLQKCPNCGAALEGR